jgi:hypothetical protein
VESWKDHAKALTTLVLAIIAAAVAAIGNGDIGDLDGNAWVKLAIVILGGSALTAFVDNVAGVYGGAIKSMIGAAVAGLAAYTAAFENDTPVTGIVTQAEWLTIIGAVVGALGIVYQVSENDEPGPVQ